MARFRCRACGSEDTFAYSGKHGWIHGHTHATYDRMVAGARLVTNQKGYGPWPPGERTWDNPDFDPHFVIEI